ncbi:nucleotide exchange factor GrpE [Halomicrobium sp. IBSBa]|uniref:nucleotide exchange factor GrpE n=1 Tax=Halomicrobium sp. IBSBa TaxID=2778916 RepID=UPI001ABF6906|nr:nucleotide exchange factor GrpE [Halomicrobium sp. IBSBa]MBO4246645.1 nucleotide exchange factor GrpE [Halomicrobium sp. IBSBa]
MTEQDAAETEASSGEADESGTERGDADVSGEAASEERGDEAVDEGLIDRVAESDPEAIATELASLRTRVDGLEGAVDERDAEIDELESKLKRKQAEFQNYKKRMKKRREEEKQRATEDLVSKLLDVRDNLQRALEQDEDVDIRDGVASTLRQFDDVLDAENVDVIEPEPGADVDPEYHQVLARVDSDQPEGTIDEVHRAGYVMAEKVLREAQVTVSEGE